MVATLKRMLGGIKLAVSFLPLTLAVGGEATFIWLACKGFEIYNNTYDEVRKTLEAEDIIDSEAELQEKLDNNEITSEEYQYKKYFWTSNGILKDFLKNDKEGNKEYLDKLNKNDIIRIIGVTLSSAYPLVAVIGLCATFDSMNSLAESGIEDFKRAKSDIEKKKTEREYNEYKEELI